MFQRLSGIKLGSIPISVAIILEITVGATSCSLFYTRPVQLMYDTRAALRAAKEVQADTLVPEVYSKAREEYVQAKTDYKFKNFRDATDHARRARRLAEFAELEAIKHGGSRDQAPIDNNDLSLAPPPLSPGDPPPQPSNQSPSSLSGPPPSLPTSPDNNNNLAPPPLDPNTSTGTK